MLDTGVVVDDGNPAGPIVPVVTGTVEGFAPPLVTVVVVGVPGAITVPAAFVAVPTGAVVPWITGVPATFVPPAAGRFSPFVLAGIPAAFVITIDG